MAGSQISTSVTIIDSLSGFMALSLTEYNTSAAAAIAAGSKVEIAGAFFQFSGDEAINAASWTAISTGSTAYIALTASGTAGSQVVTAAYTATAPTWRDDLQGWYASAASSVRVVGSVYKAEATSYYPKYIVNNKQDDSSSSQKFLSVSSSLSVAGVASFSSSISVAGRIQQSGILVSSWVHGDIITNGSVFSAMDSSIPTTDQSIIISGGLVYGPQVWVLSKAYRISSTEIGLYGVQVGGVTLYTCTSGSATSNRLSISW